MLNKTRNTCGAKQGFFEKILLENSLICAAGIVKVLALVLRSRFEQPKTWVGGEL
jgi:hypothetical protein